MSNVNTTSVIPAPCSICGSTEKRKNGICKPCANASAAKWRAANREQANAAVARWAARNIERKRSVKKAWRARNAEQINRKQAEYQRKNRAKCDAAIADWVSRNKERYRAKAKAWHEANIDRKKATNAAWKKANPDALKTYKHNRRARENQSEGKLSKGLTEKLISAQKGRCACCGQPLGTNFDLDHIVPLAKGGKNVDSNMQLLRRKCNQQKGSKDPIDFMQERGFLL
jgi:5-methylcytosine-specific restriction endonuclease McrA